MKIHDKPTPMPGEWRCAEAGCNAKIAGVSGQTIAIVRADVWVEVERGPDTRVEVRCPRCRVQQAFPGSTQGPTMSAE